MSSDVAIQTVHKVVTPKQTDQYRIVTDDPDNWYLVANQAISKGELLTPVGEAFHIDVRDVEFVDVVLKETQECRRVYTVASAVPSDSSCVQAALEIPWCFMNHSCKPNTLDRWSDTAPTDLSLAETEAVRDIAEGEMLTYDYALEQYRYSASFDCQCGEDSCRGTIRGFSELNREQQRQLLSQASPYLQERFRREFVFINPSMSPIGRHLLVDYWDCDENLLRQEAKLVERLCEAAEAAGATVLSVHSHKFERQGVTAVAILAESHISIHTWPESRYAGVDIYTCGTCDPMLAQDSLAEALAADRIEYRELARGQADASLDAPQARAGLENDASWFLEGTVPGRRHGNVNHGFNIDELICKKTTKFQECLIFDNAVYGRVLVLDGIVQLSTLDEHIYHEMLVHPALFSHPKPQRVLIVGGGDGGTLREVLRHNPEQVVMIDIDEQFVNIAKEHLPSLSDGAFDDKRVSLLFEDANDALRRYENFFDVAIIDCNDAIGPSEVLFETSFYATVARALQETGICAVQAGSMLDADFLIQTRHRMEQHLGSVTGFRLTLPSYHCGEYVFLLASNYHAPAGPDARSLIEIQTRRNIVTKHWSPAIHHASQILPPESNLW